MHVDVTIGKICGRGRGAIKLINRSASIASLVMLLACTDTAGPATDGFPTQGFYQLDLINGAAPPQIISTTILLGQPCDSWVIGGSIQVLEARQFVWQQAEPVGCTVTAPAHTVTRRGTIRLDAPSGELWLDFETVIFPDDRHEIEAEGDRLTYTHRKNRFGTPRPSTTYTYRRQ
jgi:hypothetical protein